MQTSEAHALNLSLARLAGHCLQLADSVEGLARTVGQLAKRIEAVEQHVERLASPLHREN